MPKRAGIAIVLTGAVLILSALLLLFHNRAEDNQAGREAALMLEKVEAAVGEQIAETPAPAPDMTPEIPPSPTPLSPDMPVVMIDGYGYIGYLEIPALELKLPVMAEWDYNRLYIAPCRHYGSTRTDDMIIAAHNYYRHFGRLKDLHDGDTVTFTDMDGIVSTYSIKKIGTVETYDADEILLSGYDLVLYTCTEGGQARVAVFCRRTDK